MAHCEYRSEPKEVFGAKEFTVEVSNIDNHAICRLKTRGLGDQSPCCLPGASTKDCPVARYNRGQLSLENAEAIHNRRTRQIS